MERKKQNFETERKTCMNTLQIFRELSRLPMNMLEDARERRMMWKERSWTYSPRKTISRELNRSWITVQKPTRKREGT